MENNKKGRGGRKPQEKPGKSPYQKSRPPAKKSTDYKPDRPEKRYRREEPADSNERKPSGFSKGSSPFRKDKSREFSKDKPYGKKPGGYRGRDDDAPRPFRKDSSFGDGKKPERKPRPVKADPNAPIRLNKFIANAGVCSRREADKLIETGAVKVNGVIVTELGTKVTPQDKVQLGDQTLSSEKLRYVLLNKPKGYITTTDDPFKRNTVMKLVQDACRERIYPVGRLDRNTTGLLLFTNDGELAKRLTHPRFGVRKIYDVELDKPLTKKDMDSIAAGVELDGETIIIDEIAYVEFEKNKKHVGIQLHSGQNRVVRRIFEKFGYEVLKLDRVMIGSLTKKDLPRGMSRHLTSLEVRMLKRL